MKTQVGTTRNLEEWEEKARYLGVESGEVLRKQTELADAILLEILLEEKESGSCNTCCRCCST